VQKTEKKLVINTSHYSYIKPWTFIHISSYETGWEKRTCLSRMSHFNVGKWSC